jgi:hypothetical protein
MILRMLVCWAFLVISAVPMMATTTQTTISDDLNAATKLMFAGRQSVLIQAMVSSACLSRQGIAEKDYIDKVVQGMGEFDQLLVAHRHGIAKLNTLRETDPDIIAQIKNLTKKWRGFLYVVKYDLQNGVMTDRAYSTILEQYAEIATRTRAMTRTMQTVYGAQNIHPEIANAIVVTGNTMSLMYGHLNEMCQLGASKPLHRHRADVQGKADEIQSLMADLIQGNAATGVIPPPTWEIAAQLELVFEQWEAMAKFRDITKSGKTLNAAELQSAALASEAMIAEMDIVLWMYAHF